MSQAASKTVRNDLAGFRSSGNAANNKLSQLLGTPVSENERYMQYIRDRFPNLSEDWVPYQSDVDAYAAANPQNTSGDEFGSLLKKYTGEDLASDLAG